MAERANSLPYLMASSAPGLCTPHTTCSNRQQLPRPQEVLQDIERYSSSALHFPAWIAWVFMNPLHFPLSKIFPLFESRGSQCLCHWAHSGCRHPLCSEPNPAGHVADFMTLASYGAAFSFTS